MFKISDRVVYRNYPYPGNSDCFGTVSNVAYDAVWCNNWSVGCKSGPVKTDKLELVTEEKKMVDWNEPIEYVLNDPREGFEILPATVIGQDIFDCYIVIGTRPDGKIYYSSFNEDGTNASHTELSETVLSIRNKSRWANIYVKTLNSSQVEGYVYATREEELAFASASSRVACVEIP